MDEEVMMIYIKYVAEDGVRVYGEVKKRIDVMDLTVMLCGIVFVLLCCMLRIQDVLST